MVLYIDTHILNCDSFLDCQFEGNLQLYYKTKLETQMKESRNENSL